MIKKEFRANTDYDMSLDIYTITVDEDFEFNKSLEIEDGVILDFDKDNIPISIEILDISKRLAIKKQEVASSNVAMKIICTGELLEISIVFFYKIHDEEYEKIIDSKLVNRFNVPKMELATV